VEIGGTGSTHRSDEKCVQYFRPLGGTRRRWAGNIRRDLREVGWDVVDWIHLSQYRYQWRAVVNTVMNLRVP